jgi:hypothetical protein
MECATAGPQPERLQRTKDLAFAAYCRMRRLRVQAARRLNKGQFEFVFYDPEGVWDQLHIEFGNSEAAEFDAAVRALKKMVNP